MKDSFVVVDKNGKIVSYIGEDATKVVQARVVAHGLEVYAKYKMKVNTMYTPMRMLATATSITGKKYKRGKKQYLLAAADLTLWADTMMAAMPVRYEDDRGVIEP